MAEINQGDNRQLKIEMTDGLLIPAKGEKGLFSAWRICFYGSIAVLIALPLFSPKPYVAI